MKKHLMVLHVFGTRGERDEKYLDVIMNEPDARDIDRTCRRYQLGNEDHVYIVVNSADAIPGMKGLRAARIIEYLGFVAPSGWYEFKKEMRS